MTGRIPVTTVGTTEISFTSVNALILDTELTLYLSIWSNIDIYKLYTFINYNALSIPVISPT